MQSCGEPQAWADQAAWRILDTGFTNGLRFLRTWHAWLADAQRPRMLHYVALARQAPETDALLQAALAFPELQPLVQALADQCLDLLPGFHRLSLQDGRVLLTLCVGETQTLLREQQFAADSVFLDANSLQGETSRWTIKALARCCRRGTGLTSNEPLESSHPAWAAWLAQAGFEAPSGHPSKQWTFNPPWELKTTRHPHLARATRPAQVTTCAVIGAGLAGASIAAALARRGWQVQVLDAGAMPAAGASGLPVGLMVPHVSADDSPRSRLSRNGIRQTLQQAHSLLKAGQDWAMSGVLEHREVGTPSIRTLWHPRAAWIKPAQLVRAWLTQPGIRFTPNAEVAALRRKGDAWLLLDAQGQPLAQASHVVIANACGAEALLNDLHATLPDVRPRLARLPRLQGVRGVMSWGVHQADELAALPPFPVNGLGGLIPNIPMDEPNDKDPAGARAWYVGATYEADDQVAAPDTEQHQTNLDKLQQLLPTVAQALRPAFIAGRVHAWRGTRCVTPDRLPVVGPLDAGMEGDNATGPSLWISAAMGSRGLSFAVLCAEVLAARLGAEPLPLEASLARQLDALRVPSRA